MISLLISLLVLVAIFAFIWWILSLIPWPTNFPIWIVHVLFAIIFLIAFIEVLTGGVAILPRGFVR